MLIKMMQLNVDFRGSGVGVTEIYVNPNHIVSVTDSGYSDRLLQEVSHLVEFDAKFSKLILNEGGKSKSIVVIGTPQEIYSQINKKQILRG
ncbi:MAG: hypothetical protein ACXADH_03045 [Candidatus Kariarchaeaceae archaeon]|jgi:hypothetical protein